MSQSNPMLPRLPLVLLRALLPRAERDEVLADLAAEYAHLAAHHSRAAARQWLWRQALSSTPALLRWSWWRSWTGFEPRANTFRPRGPMLKTWMTDARYAVRRLRARPSYTVIAVLTLSLGIGGTAAVFGIARPLIFDALPYANARDVGVFWMPGWWTEEELLFLRGKYAGFKSVGAYRPGDMTLRDGDGPTRLIPGVQVTAELFDVLGARPVLGRNFQPGDDARGSEPVAMISYGLWQELGGSPSIVGTRMILDGEPRTIIGVMPRRFWFPTPDIRIWHSDPLDPEGRNGSYALVGQVAPGNDVRHMGPQLERLTKIIGERFQYAAKADKTKEPVLKPLRDELLGSIRPAVVATFVAMALILLIACTNVAALMLGQVEGRSTELAVRAALGATRGRITQQLVVEALVLGVVAGLVGAALAAGGFRLLAGALPIGAWSDNVSVDWSVVVAALAIAVLAVLFVVLVPATSLWRGNLRDGLNRARTGGVHGRGGRLEHGLVVAEVGVAMLIATGTALLVRSVANRYAIDPGIDAKDVAVVDFIVPSNVTPRDRRRTTNELLASLSSLPGVRSTASAMKLPLRGGGDSFGITIQGHENAEQSFTYFRIVTPDYFSTMDIKVVAGRGFAASDRPDSTEVPVVINQALVKKYFPGENPLGRIMGDGFGVRQRVIGIVGDVAEAELQKEAEPTRYYSANTVGMFGARQSVVVRVTRGSDPATILDLARRTAQRVAPSFALQGTTTMQRVLDAAVGPVRQIMSLLALLAALALVLGAVGIYGVISHFAARRQRDWAIRVALGLPGSSVVKHIVGQGAGLVALGIALGAIGTLALARLLTSFLFGVSAVDPISFAAASGAMLLVGLGAAFIPARRAGTVDPALVLREQ